MDAAVEDGAGADPGHCCLIRYRFNGPGPAALIVECAGRPHLYARGRMSAALAPQVLAAILAGRGGRWVPASGEVRLPGPIVPGVAPARSDAPSDDPLDAAMA